MTTTSDVTGTATVTNTLTDKVSFNSGSHRIDFYAPTGHGFTPGDYGASGDPADRDGTTAALSVDGATCGTAFFHVYHAAVANDAGTVGGSSTVTNYGARGYQDCTGTGGTKTWVDVRYQSSYEAFYRTIAPGALDFGSSELNVQGNTLSVTYTASVGYSGTTNTSNVVNVLLGGQDPGSWTKTFDTCTGHEVTNTACRVDVRFDAQGPVGEKNANLLFTDNISPDGRAVLLQGTTSDPEMHGLDLEAVAEQETGVAFSVKVHAIDGAGGDSYPRTTRSRRPTTAYIPSPD
jgi:hypothetical protein